MTFWERLKYSMVRPDDDPKEKEVEEIRPVEEIEADIARSNDKERAIGLVAAPVAALIGLIISSASINYAKTHNQSVSVYDKLTYVLLALAALVLITSLLRKRLFQGITLALYGLAIFQLHYTYFGFAAPFLLAGAWYLVRAYRLQQELKRAEAAGPDAPRPKGSTAAAPRPRRNKRYTPPS
jgi:Ca2+/Na+ antiporter